MSHPFFFVMEMFFIYLFQYSISGAKIQIIWFPIVKVSQKTSKLSQIAEKKFVLSRHET